MMATLQTQVREAWQARTARERLLLGVMAGLLLVVLIWLGVIAPLNRWVADSAARRDAALAQLAQVRTDAAQISAARAGEGGSAGDLANLLTETAVQAGVTVARSQPEGAGDLTVFIEGGQPAQVFGWIATLRQSHGVGVASLTALKGAGGLDVQVTFRRIGA